MEASPVGGRGPGGRGAGGPKEQPPHRHSPDCGKKPNWRTLARTACWYAQRLTYEEISAKLHSARETGSGAATTASARWSTRRSTRTTTGCISTSTARPDALGTLTRNCNLVVARN